MSVRIGTFEELPNLIQPGACRENVLVEKGDVEANFMAFRKHCEGISDLWIWK